MNLRRDPCVWLVALWNEGNPIYFQSILPPPPVVKILVAACSANISSRNPRLSVKLQWRQKSTVHRGCTVWLLCLWSRSCSTPRGFHTLWKGWEVHPVIFPFRKQPRHKQWVFGWWLMWGISVFCSHVVAEVKVKICLAWNSAEFVQRGNSCHFSC